MKIRLDRKKKREVGQPSPKQSSKRSRANFDLRQQPSPLYLWALCVKHNTV